MSPDHPIVLPLVPGASLEEAASWFFENSSDGFALSKDRIILNVNRAWCVIARCNQQDAVGQTGSDLVHPDELPAYHKGEFTLQENGVAEFENRMRTGDGGWVWVRTSVKRGPDGFAMIVIHDLTAERTIHKEVADATESNDLLRSAAGVILWRFDPDGDHFISDAYFNAAEEQGVLAGVKIPAAQVEAQIHPEDRQYFSDAIVHSAETGEPGQFSYRQSVGNGDWANYKSSWRGLKCGESGKWELTGIAQDITELVGARDAALRGEKAAKDADHSKSEFITNLSHEIRTPLNGVLGVLHLLANEQLSVEMKSLVMEGIACGGMLTTLLNDVLDLSMIEGHSVKLAPEIIDAVALVGSVAQMFRPQIEGKGLYMRTHAPPMNGQMWVDGTRLRQILVNLIGNAIKFTQRGGITIRATDFGEGQSHRLRVEVEDTGIGIDEGAQVKVFNRFFQVDGSQTRRFGGTGLGLAVAERLAELMGGNIGVESQLGRGSTFWVEIAAPSVDKAEVSEVESENVLEGLQILVVDDNSTNRIIATKMLQSLGALVETADDGVEGVEAVRRRSFDLIFMDIQMPDMDGIEATRLIRNMASPEGETPILAMTANVMAHQVAHYRAVGMDGVVAKPLSPSSIVEEIARLADSPQTRQAS